MYFSRLLPLKVGANNKKLALQFSNYSFRPFEELLKTNS